MNDTLPLWIASDAISHAVEVAHELAYLSEIESEADRIATSRHIGAILQVTHLAARQLTARLQDQEGESLTSGPATEYQGFAKPLQAEPNATGEVLA